MNNQNKSFDIVNNWLGWGDPYNGLWFIGMEEGGIFNKGLIEARRNKKFDYVSSNDKEEFLIANKVAKIMTTLCNIDNIQNYRDRKMWHKGSQVFNGNLLPIGKSSLKSWSSNYDELFGFTFDTYKNNRQKIEAERFRIFQDFREKNNPQAIICFGKGFWDKFEKVFIQYSDDKKVYEDLKITVYERDKVILIGHISYGIHFTNKALDFLVEKLNSWNIVIEDNSKKC